MPTLFQKGDLLHTDGLVAFAHGCDSSGAMDSGVSLAFKKRWPDMQREVAARLERRESKLGDAIAWKGDGVTVFSLVLREPAAKKAKIATLSRALGSMIALAQAAEIDRIGMPRLGAGPMGLDAIRVKKLLTELGETTPVTLLVFDQFVRAPATSA